MKQFLHSKLDAYKFDDIRKQMPVWYLTLLEEKLEELPVEESCRKHPIIRQAQVEEFSSAISQNPELISELAKAVEYLISEKK